MATIKFHRKAPIMSMKAKIKRNLRLTGLGKMFRMKKYKA